MKLNKVPKIQNMSWIKLPRPHISCKKHHLYTDPLPPPLHTHINFGYVVYCLVGAQNCFQLYNV